MAEIVAKIVLTGGPCAGKTTALARIEEDLQEKGYYVLVVSESATELIKGGIKPFGDNAIKMFDFQKLIMNYQMNKENTYEEAIKLLPNDKKCVIVYDRGIMDNKAYISDSEFHDILKLLDLNQLELLDRYDMVIHLVTAADGKEKYYTLANNQARSETIEQARELDQKSLQAWTGHNNLVIIDNKTDFEEKIKKVLDCIHNLLGNPISLKQQKLYAVDLNQSLSIPNSEEIKLEYFYLIGDKYERRLKKRTQNNQTTYYLTVQNRNKGLAKVITDKKITAKEFDRLLVTQNIKATLEKTRYCFSKNKQYFKLDIFNDSNIGLLQLDITQDNPNVFLPEELKIIEEVTDDINYQSYNMALKNKDKSKKLSIKKSVL